MQLVSIEKGKTTRLFYAVAGLTAAIMLLTAKEENISVVLAAIVLAIVSICPLYLWLLRWSHGLPIWPSYVVFTGMTAALPMIQESNNLNDYTSQDVIVGAVTLIGFFALGTLIWLAMTSRKLAPPRKILMISGKNSERFLFAFIILGLLFYLNEFLGFFSGNFMQVIRGVSGALSTLGIFALAFYDGRGLLSRIQSFWLVVLTSLIALLAAAGLVMATAFLPVAMLLVGYALGAGRVPWRSLTVVLLIIAILHPGKFAMRKAYWGESAHSLTLFTLPEFYSDWFSNGLDQVGTMVGLSSAVPEEKIESTLFERSGTLHMLLLVQRKSPSSVPFLVGRSYSPIPRLLIPRIIDRSKGISHAGNVLLSTRYGLQTLEETESTSIAWGLVPEAYANFGYWGVAGLAIFLVVFYSWVTNLTRDVPMTSLRFVIGLLVMGASFTTDTMGVFVTSQFQGVMGISLAAIFLMRSQRNPFVVEQETEGAFAEENHGRGRTRVNHAYKHLTQVPRERTPRWMAHGRGGASAKERNSRSESIKQKAKAQGIFSGMHSPYRRTNRRSSPK